MEIRTVAANQYFQQQNNRVEDVRRTEKTAEIKTENIRIEAANRQSEIENRKVVESKRIEKDVESNALKEKELYNNTNKQSENQRNAYHSRQVGQKVDIFV